MRPGETVQVTDLHDYGGFGRGWSVPEATGIWTEGERAELRIAAEGADSGDYQLSLSVAMLCVEPDETLRVDAEATGVQIATRRFSGPAPRQWRLDLPAHAARDSALTLTLLVDSPRSPVERGWSGDERRLGVHIHDLMLKRVDRSVALSDRIEFGEGSGAESLLGDGWSVMEPAGVWTEEEMARLVFRLTDPPLADLDVLLEVFPFVTAEHRELDVEIHAAGRRIAVHTFRHGGPQQAVRIRLPRASLDPDGRAVLELHVLEPARPVDLGVGSDTRRLGVQLRSLTVVESGTVIGPEPDAATEPGAGILGKLRAQLSRSIRS
jgi:hypothetical protein